MSKTKTSILWLIMVFGMILIFGYFSQAPIPPVKDQYNFYLSQTYFDGKLTLKEVRYVSTGLYLPQGPVVQLEGRLETSKPGLAGKDYYLECVVSETPKGEARHCEILDSSSKPGSFLATCSIPPYSSAYLYWHIYVTAYEDSEVMKEMDFTTPNPARVAPFLGLVSASSLPQSSTSGDLKVQLQTIRPEGPQPPSLTYDITNWLQGSHHMPLLLGSSITYDVWCKGRETSSWGCKSLLITGNRGMKEEYYGSWIASQRHLGCSLLRRDDGPYKIDMILDQLSRFYDPKVSLKSLPFPKPDEIIPLNTDWTAFGTVVHFWGLYGKGAQLPLPLGLAKESCLAFSIEGNPNTTISVLYQAQTGVGQPLQFINDGFTVQARKHPLLLSLTTDPRFILNCFDVTAEGGEERKFSFTTDVSDVVVRR